MRNDYKNNSTVITKKQKRDCFFRIFKNLLSYIWSGISAPFIYPIWYIFRKPITEKIYRGTTWEAIEYLMFINETELAKKKLKANGKFLYWLWTYGDAKDPLGRGGMPLSYKNGKNTFWNRYCYSAFRNARFNINYMEFRTGFILDRVVIIDKRNFNYMHRSEGIGDSPDGIVLIWMRDNYDKWYFIFEDNNVENIFYFGYTGLLKDKKTGGRFETSYRKTDSSYIKF